MLGVPTVVGVSRKSMLSKVVGHDPQALLAAGVNVAYRACVQGAKVIRTHDVGATKKVINLFLKDEIPNHAKNQAVMDAVQKIDAVMAED